MNDPNLVMVNLYIFAKEVKTALYATTEFENFECDCGPSLDECVNEDCLPSRVYKAIKLLEKETGYINIE